MNARMSDVNIGTFDRADYQDLCDDQVYTYFDLPIGTAQKRKCRVQFGCGY